MALLATALACLAMHPGCSGPTVAAPPTLSNFALVYRRSGGLKPTSRKLKIGPNQVGTMEELRSGIGRGKGAATIFKVPASTIKGLRRALGQARFVTLPSPGTDPSGCADCFSYEIRYRNHEVAFDDVTMPPSLRPVLHRLEAIADAHRPFH
jgi:hypothetical protein